MRRRTILQVSLAVLLLVSASSAYPSGPQSIEFKFKLGEKSLGKDLYQMAVWIETLDGKYIDTVYVTADVGKKGLGNKYITFFGITIREAPESLPVWANARGVRYGKSLYPPKKKPLPDAITGATPDIREFTKTLQMSPELRKKIDKSRVVCVAEINVSRDKVPSIVFKETLDLTKDTDCVLKFVGTGHPKGADGGINQEDNDSLHPAEYIETATVTHHENNHGATSNE